MSQMQSIIIYRNPMEAMVWESMMDFGNFIPMFAGLLVFFFCVMVISQAIHNFFGYREPQWTQWVMWLVSSAAGIFVANHLWLAQ